MTVAAEVLLIEDDRMFARSMERTLRKEGHSVRVAPDLESARALLKQQRPDVVIADMGLPDGRGVEIASAVAADAPDVPLVIITGNPSLDSAVEALRARAFDYLTKPFSENALALTLHRALEVSRLRRELAALQSTLAKDDGGIIGRSAAMAAVRERVRAVAGTTATVLVTGESGTGKECVARAVHALSGRAGPFVPLNCSSVPETLFEAELFGARRGAFTGAVADRPGLVAESARGTLFLDEVGDMPSAIQPKLLRLLQERTYRSLGRDREERAETRVIAATNRPLRDMVEEKIFREDLYWRLAVVEIAIPPLRSRPEDIVTLAAHILALLAARHGRAEIPALSPAALAALERHRWPGNVRELENVLERAVLFSRSRRIEESDLNLAVEETSAELPALDDVIRRSADRVEREYIVKVLRRADGSVTEAARRAGRNRTSFYRLLSKHGLKAETGVPQ